MFRQGFTCPALLTFHHSGPVAYRAVTFYGQSFQTVLLEPEQLLGCSPFARRYWGNLGCFLFLRLLRYFSSPGSLPMAMYSPLDTPFGVGFPIRTLPDQSLFPAPRHFSKRKSTRRYSSHSCTSR